MGRKRLEDRDMANKPRLKTLCSVLGMNYLNLVNKILIKKKSEIGKYNKSKLVRDLIDFYVLHHPDILD